MFSDPNRLKGVPSYIEWLRGKISSMKKTVGFFSVFLFTNFEFAFMYVVLTLLLR